MNLFYLQKKKLYLLKFYLKMAKTLKINVKIHAIGCVAFEIFKFEDWKSDFSTFFDIISWF